jgi:hypothetical protein
VNAEDLEELFVSAKGLAALVASSADLRLAELAAATGSV